MKSIIFPIFLLSVLVFACHQTTTPQIREISRASFASEKLACRFSISPDLACKKQLPEGYQPIVVDNEWDFISGYFNDDNITDYAEIRINNNLTPLF